jgi:hypothetical protein
MFAELRLGGDMVRAYAKRRTRSLLARQPVSAPRSGKKDITLDSHKLSHLGEMVLRIEDRWSRRFKLAPGFGEPIIGVTEAITAIRINKAILAESPDVAPLGG